MLDFFFGSVGSLLLQTTELILSSLLLLCARNVAFHEQVIGVLMLGVTQYYRSLRFCLNV